MKAQMKAADRSGAALAVIIGPDELAAGTAVVRAASRGDARPADRRRPQTTCSPTVEKLLAVT